MNIIASGVIYKATNVGESQVATLRREDEDSVFPLESVRLSQVAELLGGRQTLRIYPRNPLEAHEMLTQGLPGKALVHLVENFLVLSWDTALANAIGMSQRTYQRHIAMRTKFLNQEQSGKAWKLAEILAKASEVFGSREEAEQWLERPAVGLNQRRPIDLLATPAGVELVENFLDRLDYGVYT